MIALWRGWLPSVIGVIPYVGLNFSVYETLKDMTLKAYGEQMLYISLLFCDLVAVQGIRQNHMPQHQHADMFVWAVRLHMPAALLAHAADRICC